MQSIIKTPTLIVSSDISLCNPRSDTATRMSTYTELYEKVHVILCAPNISCNEGEVVPLVHLYPVSYSNKVEGLTKTFIMLVRLTRTVRPASLISQDAFAFGLITLVVGRLRQIPVVVGIYGTDIHNTFVRTESLKHRFYAWIARYVLRKADVIQTDGPETIDRLQKKYGKKVFFKPMFPGNVHELQSVVRRVPETPFMVLFVGRFVAQKNIKKLVAVIEETKRRAGDSIHFTIIGEGPEKAWFTKEINTRNLVPIVEMKGVLARNDVMSAYTAHHVLLLTSRYEGLPRVFMEAALTGVPVVTTDVGGIVGLIVDNESGYVLPQEADPSEFAERLMFLSHHKDVLEVFSHKIKERFDTLYEGKTILDYQRPIVEFLEQKIASAEQ